MTGRCILKFVVNSTRIKKYNESSVLHLVPFGENTLARRLKGERSRVHTIFCLTGKLHTFQEVQRVLVSCTHLGLGGARKALASLTKTDSRRTSHRLNWHMRAC